MTVKNYLLPTSLDEAVSLLAEHKDALLVMAGGTLAMPLINGGVSVPDMVMGLRFAGLNMVRRDNGSVVIGATTNLTRMRDLAVIPMLQEAAGHTASWTIRNMATVGGNLFAPPPAGDFAVALLALDAQLKLVSQSGTRLVALEAFYTDFMSNVLRDDELVAEIVVPLPSGKTAYTKFGRKLANTPSVVTVATHIQIDGNRVKNARLALNGVGPHPMRAKSAEAALIGSPLTEETIAAVSAAAAEACEPFTDAVASAWYRRKMTGVMVRRTLARIAGEGG